MGCGNSMPGPIADPGRPGPADDPLSTPLVNSKQKDMRLLEEYSVGQTLGEGAFGVVSNCRKRSTGEEFAVKMVDKVETPVDAIKKEAAMLLAMDHPNIVKCHGVYYERCFVCIVMDKYAGGDLVEGLQRHLKERGQIHCGNVVHVARQTGASIQYLHYKGTVHRDIKGDNYLMDRKDMTDPACKIVLTDFGTVCNISPEERLSTAVGTKIFWAPEFFDKNYGQKVDVWAMGVVMYGLVSGRFPFRDEADIRAKEVKIPKRVHATCEEFIKKMLEKKEAVRFDSAAVMAHAWVAQSQSNGNSGSTKQSLPHSNSSVEDAADGGAPQNLRVDTANDGIKERRQELINRLNKEHEAKKEGKRGGDAIRRLASTHAESKKFVLQDKQGNKMEYEWWDPQRIKQTGLLEVEGHTIAKKEDIKEDASDLKMFSQMLEEHKITPSLFGQGIAKPLHLLAQEVRSGAARLMLDATEHKKLVRVVDVVVLRIRDKADGHLIIETEEKYPDGRTRETLRLPGTKKEPHENTRQTAERIMTEMLKMNSSVVRLDLTRMYRHEEETESPSYPGVRTVYRKEIVDGVVATQDKGELEKIGLPGHLPWSGTDADGNTKFLQWMTDKQAESKKVKLSPEGGQVVSTLVRAPIGMSEEALRQHLQSKGIDTSKFGQAGTKTLKEFSAELIKGEATLTQDKHGTLLRVVDVVVLIIKRASTGEVLVQTAQYTPDGAKMVLNRLPGAKRRPDENQFLSARRIIRRQLEIDENQVQIEQEVQQITEEKPSPAYPDLKTVYRKRLIRGTSQFG